MHRNTGVATSGETTCFHCGEPTGESGLAHDGNVFCCTGCALVYDILRENNLCQYYSLSEAPGRPPLYAGDARYEYLDDPGTVGELLEFSDDRVRSVTFTVPGMHCSSCVWLLENLHRLKPGIVQSRVDLLRKTIQIRFTASTTLREVVELLASLGYEPDISLASLERKSRAPSSRPLYARIGVAGFCFANIMLFSFPEYLSGGAVDPELAGIFRILSLLLALPVFFYSSSDYFRSSWAGLRRRIVTLDVPIALGIVILFGRSLSDILSGTGPGFLDSLSGLVFFLLVGKLFQAKTYDRLNFERTYTSYFPLAVAVRKNGSESMLPLSRLAVGDRMVVRNGGLIPADSLLLGGSALIDYSFVTGESRVVPRRTGELVYAGGRQRGGAIELETIREVSQSYLTRLWSASGRPESGRGDLVTVSNAVGRYFTAGVLALAALAAALWLPEDPARALNAVTGVLIVACPCALALSTPFTFGGMMRAFGRHGFYLKGAAVVESLSKIDTVVFDKTGTLTHAGDSSVRFVGKTLSAREEDLIASLVRGSAHPLSRAIHAALGGRSRLPVAEFSETPGEGIAGRVDGVALRVGSAGFVVRKVPDERPVPLETRVHVAMEGALRGYFAVNNRYREGLGGLFERLARKYRLIILSGDNAAEQEVLERFSGGRALLHFNQSPADKLAVIAALQRQGRRVMMIGDGLNDAAALRQSDAGVALAEDASAFTPSSDGIISAGSLLRIEGFLRLARVSLLIIIGSFIVSFLYNAAALTVALRGELTPVLAAILMPLSSITVVTLSSLGVRSACRRRGFA